MLRLGNIHQILLLLLAALWRPSATSRAWSGLNSSKDPNVRDWGDYSDLPAAVPQGPEQTGTTHDHGGVSGSTSWNLPLAPELDFLAEFAGKSNLTSLADLCRGIFFLFWDLLAVPTTIYVSFALGKKRLWVITAPSHNNHYLRMMEKQLEDAEQAVSRILCCMIFGCNFFLWSLFCLIVTTVPGLFQFLFYYSADSRKCGCTFCRLLSLFTV